MADEGAIPLAHERVGEGARRAQPVDEIRFRCPAEGGADDSMDGWTFGSALKADRHRLTRPTPLRRRGRGRTARSPG